MMRARRKIGGSVGAVAAVLLDRFLEVFDVVDTVIGFGGYRENLGNWQDWLAGIDTYTPAIRVGLWALTVAFLTWGFYPELSALYRKLRQTPSISPIPQSRTLPEPDSGPELSSVERNFYAAPKNGKLAATLIQLQKTADAAEQVFEVWKSQEDKTDPKLVYDVYIEVLTQHGEEAETLEQSSERFQDAVIDRGFYHSDDEEYF